MINRTFDSQENPEFGCDLERGMRKIFCHDKGARLTGFYVQTC